MGKLSDLASAFKQAIDDEEDRRKAEEAEAKQRAEEAAARETKVKAMRKELLSELVEFAESLGHVKSKQKKTGGVLEIAFGERKLRFEPEDDASLIALRYDGHSDQDCVYLDSNDDWIVSREIGGQLHTQELIIDGLKTLMVQVLGLPPIAGQAPVEPTPAEKPSKVPRPAAARADDTPSSEPAKHGEASGPGSAVTDLTNPWD